jgi:hypothetical protein
VYRLKLNGASAEYKTNLLGDMQAGQLSCAISKVATGRTVTVLLSAERYNVQINCKGRLLCNGQRYYSATTELLQRYYSATTELLESYYSATTELLQSY